MPDPVTAAIGAVSSLGSAALGTSAASKAGKAQAQAADAAAAEQRAAREEMRTLLQPYVSAGTPALQQMMALAGLDVPASAGTPDYASYVLNNPDLLADYQKVGDQFGNIEAYGQYHYDRYGQSEGRTLPTTGGTEAIDGATAQAAAISQIENDPTFQALVRQGEDSILQNASATGGLRGGNVQGALAQFRPAMLNQRINEQYARLAGLTTLGQQSAAGVGTSGIQSASNIGAALGEAGAARAGAALGQGQAWGNAIGQIGQIAGMAIGGPTAMQKWGF